MTAAELVLDLVVPLEADDADAVEGAVVAHHSGRITRKELVARVRAAVEEYDAVARAMVCESVADVLGVDVEDLFRRPARRRGGGELCGLGLRFW